VATTEKRRRGGSLGFIIGIAVGIPATIFALSNLESADVEFLGWQAEVPLWAVIGLSLLAGIVIGMGVLLAVQARRRRERKREVKSARKREQAQRQLETAEATTVPEPSSRSAAEPEVTTRSTDDPPRPSA
jgi:uncharacterized integral membrane protein